MPHPGLADELASDDAARTVQRGILPEEFGDDGTEYFGR